jgi:uncharacterized lipoprotein YmbA
MTRRIPVLPTLRNGAMASLAALLCACSSVSPPRFHTLMPAPDSATSTVAPSGALAWEVLPVAIPAQVDQPQWVVRTVDGSLAVLEQERWIAPLGEEIRAAVVDRLTRTLGAPAAPIEPGKLWRVRIDVQRFDSAPGREVRLEATWTVSSSAETAVPLRCHGDFVQQITAGGYPALASGHQQGVTRLADRIAQALKLLSAGQPAACEA